nr:immunoglobulin light chain junction region [Mus musculus]NSM02594.1 immunoglobulin light chain junction region [Mus musculus]
CQQWSSNPPITF